MRLDEFYSPEDDAWQRRNKGDTRKPKLTLEQLNKLRKVREIKKAEEIASLNRYEKLAVISAIGTRDYYHKNGFELNNLYQVKKL